MWSTVVRGPVAGLALAYVAVVIVAALAAPWLAPYGATTTDMQHVLSGPTSRHLLGTDGLGRDVLSRLMYGARVSLAGAATAALTALVLGVTLGMLAGYLGGWADRTISWFTDMAMAIPAIITLLVVVAVFSGNETAAMITLGVLTTPGPARVVRGISMTARQDLYVAAARVAGLANVRIIVGQVLPRVVGPILVQTSLIAGGALMAETGLGFLGLGVQPPTPTWGGMVADASQVIRRQPLLLVPTGGVIALTILAFGLLGDALRDAAADRTGRGGPRKLRLRRRDTTRAGGTPSQGRRSGQGTPRPQPPRPQPARPEPARPEPARPQPARPDLPQDALLSLRQVTVTLGTALAEGVDLDVYPGEIVGLVGESGSGKSITGRAILGLLPGGGRISSGSIMFEGTNLAALSEKAWRGIRGSQIARVSQQPIGSLDPVFTVGSQLEELVRRHRPGLGREAVRARAVELLAGVRLRDPAAVARRYPHELSGGMAQRVAIALALAGDPRLLIADEPTTALDVTVQAEILDLLRTLQRERGMAVLLISHDWGVIADLCQRAYVIYAGHIVEAAPVTELFDNPRHPYTAGLLECSPRRVRPQSRLRAIEGTVPDPKAWPTGCHFRSRCPLATTACGEQPLPVHEPEPGHVTRCIRHHEVRQEDDHARSGASA